MKRAGGAGSDPLESDKMSAQEDERAAEAPAAAGAGAAEIAIKADFEQQPAAKKPRVSQKEKRRIRHQKMNDRSRDSTKLSSSEAELWLERKQSNEALSAYYGEIFPALLNAQQEENIDGQKEDMCAAELEEMLDALRRPLPTTFRLTPHTKRFDQLVAQLESGELWELDGDDDGMIPVPPSQYKRKLHLFQLSQAEKQHAASAVETLDGDKELSTAQTSAGDDAKSPTEIRDRLMTGRNVTTEAFEGALAAAEIPLIRVPAPQRVPFFAGASKGLAQRSEVWGCPLAKREIRDIPRLRLLHQWLVRETDAGNVSRQELVSMIPPFFMGVERGHRVLDMCAAPGSKTVQILEWLDPGQRANELPTGVVVANDSDAKRCFMLTHQTQRLNTPCFLVVNHEAQRLPTIRGMRREDNAVTFDRVLADVPCSGDGTFRKNPELWRTWTPRGAINLHTLQVQILLRGLGLLEPGGRLVYSTCSMNPIEDEAVIAEALRAWNKHAPILHKDQPARVERIKSTTINAGARNSDADVVDLEPEPIGDVEEADTRPAGDLQVRLVDVRNELPYLKRKTGISSWRVMDQGNVWYDKWEEVLEATARQLEERTSHGPPAAGETHAERNRRKRRAKAERVPLSHRIRASMFPPTQEEAEWMHLEHCMRVLPHLQDTGGFFIAVLEKEARKPTHVEQSAEPSSGQPSDSASELLHFPNTTADAFEEGKWKNSSEMPWVPAIDHSPARETLDNILDYFGLVGFPKECAYVRTPSANKISFVSPGVRDILRKDWARGVEHARLLPINTGVLIFQRHDRTQFNLPCDYRLAQDGLRWLWPYLEKGSGARIMNVPWQTFGVLVDEPVTSHVQYTALPAEARARAQEIGRGNCIIRVVEDEAAGHWSGFLASAWLGINTMHLLVPKEDRELLQTLRPTVSE